MVALWIPPVPLLGLYDVSATGSITQEWPWLSLGQEKMGWHNNFFWVSEYFAPSNVPLVWPLKRTVSNGKQGYKPASEGDLAHSSMYFMRLNHRFSLNQPLTPREPCMLYDLWGPRTCTFWHSALCTKRASRVVLQQPQLSVIREQVSRVRYSGFKVLLCLGNPEQVA